MIAIKGTILPGKCTDCPFIHYTMRGSYKCMMHRPGYLGDKMIGQQVGKPDWCPLVEVPDKEER